MYAEVTIRNSPTWRWRRKCGVWGYAAPGIYAAGISGGVGTNGAGPPGLPERSWWRVSDLSTDRDISLAAADSMPREPRHGLIEPTTVAGRFVRTADAIAITGRYGR